MNNQHVKDCVDVATEMTKEVRRLKQLLKKCEVNAQYQFKVDVELLKQVNLKLQSVMTDLYYLGEVDGSDS